MGAEPGILEQIASVLVSAVKFVVCPVIWIVKTSADFAYQLVRNVLALLLFLGRTALFCSKESVRSSFWISYYTVYIPLSAIHQVGNALFWLLRLIVGGIHFVFFVAFVNIILDVWSIVSGLTHLVCVFFGVIGLALALVVSVTCRSVALVVGLACGFVRNIMALVSSVFGGAVMPGLV